MVARDKGAKGLMVVSGPTAQVEKQLVPLTFDASLAGTSIAALSVSDEVVQQWFKSEGEDLRRTQEKLDVGDQMIGFELSGLSIGATIDIQQAKRKGRNVLARLGATQSTGANAVVIGAHVDHLGRGIGANSLATDDEIDDIHFGADDNASGVAALIVIARHLSDQAKTGRIKTQRDLVFAAWSGEELGLLGSNYFVRTFRSPDGDDEPICPAVVAYLNLDMIGRYRNGLTLHGVGSSSSWPSLIERANVSLALRIVPEQNSYVPTDATSFYVRGVPILSAFTGAHSDYHTPRDTPDKINYASTRRIAQFIARVARDLATADRIPDYIASDRPKPGTSRASMRAYLGTIPDYSQTDVVGVKLAGVSGKGPAARAGITGGDVVVELAGRKIENIYDYTYAISALKVGQAVDIVTIRDGERIKLCITPKSRE